ncbi:MAG TPA: cation diffusion facilitator family transporter [Candidatus Dormibacteraeota bacterium]|nr:cation diffusion facilitator family transporter [Candidatus Dormibacteraeota bacterium]
MDVGMTSLGRRPVLVAVASVAIGVLLVAGKLVVGLLTGSLGILSEAVHSLLDVAASAFALVAVGTSRKPADTEHPYGHGRTENLAAFAEGVILVITAGGIAVEAVHRLLTGGHEVDAAWYAFALLVGTIVIESGRAAVLRAVGRAADSAALEADATNRLSDVLASLAVLAGLALVRVGLTWADSVAALLVAAVIARAALLLIWRSGDILIDRAPAGAVDTVRTAAMRVNGVREVRSVRLRRSGPVLLGDVSIATRRMLPVEAAKAMVEDVKRAARDALPSLELNVQVEGQERSGDLVERIHAAAARDGGVRDLHNVTVELENDGTLHLSMHVKLRGDISLATANATRARFEQNLREELPDASRIDIHLEPLEPTVIRGEDVTEQHAQLAARIREVVRSHPEVRRTVDVELSDRHGHIYAYVTAALSGDVSLEHAHQVETELEGQIRLEVPEVREVVASATT